MQIQPELHTDPSIYSRQFPRFDRPKVIGYIGLENLKFIKKLDNNNVCFDLNLHLNKAKRKPADRDVKLDDLLNFLFKNEQSINFPNVNNSINNAVIHCYRGLMTCIACTPYEDREPWKIVAILFKGHIYLCARDTEEKKIRNQNMSERDKQFTSWGYKFEQFMTSDDPESMPNPDVPVDENEEFSLVFTTKLNDHKIVYGAEMDAIRCDRRNVSSPPSVDNIDTVIDYLHDKEFIELKTNRHIESRRQEINFRKFKCKKWWCQSFLAGVDTILCGLRNDQGIVEELKTFTVKELSKESQKYWNGNVCFNFLDTFFIYVKRCLNRKIKQKYGEKHLHNIKSLPLLAILFEWYPRAPVLVNENYVYEDDPILPELFLKNYGKHCDIQS